MFNLRTGASFGGEADQVASSGGAVFRFDQNGYSNVHKSALQRRAEDLSKEYAPIVHVRNTRTGGRFIMPAAHVALREPDFKNGTLEIIGVHRDSALLPGAELLGLSMVHSPFS